MLFLCSYLTSSVKKQLSHVELEYFDPNVTSHMQPLDMGIKRSEKAYYKIALVKHCLLEVEEKGEIIMPTIKEAIIMIKNAWKKVIHILNLLIYSFVFLFIYVR